MISSCPWTCHNEALVWIALHSTQSPLIYLKVSDKAVTRVKSSYNAVERRRRRRIDNLDNRTQIIAISLSDLATWSWQ